MTVYTLDQPIPDPVDLLDGGWADRVRFVDGHHGYAYRPRRVLVHGDAAFELAHEIHHPGGPPPDLGSPTLLGFRLVEVPEGTELHTVHQIRVQGLTAEPDYVLFADSVSANPAWANPAWANPAWANPAWANPAWANPAWANPAWANPAWANPGWANPVYPSPVYPSPFRSGGPDGDEYKRTGKRMSTARPARQDEAGVLPQEPGGMPHDVDLLVLDTGLAWRAVVDGQDVLEQPHLLTRLGRPARRDQDGPDDDNDRLLEPVAGHGTFIGGIVERLAPGCRLGVGRVLRSYGDASAWEIAHRVVEIARNDFPVAGRGNPYTVRLRAHAIVNLSLSGYAPDEMACLATAIHAVRHAHGTVFVASAGNDATTRPAYPACIHGVVGVGAVGPYGPASFTNGGDWVRACAPGVDIVSTFFRRWNGILPPQPGSFDPDDFRGWARWSGTSFAAPYVVGALAREMLRSGCTAAEAVERVIDAPWLLRIPGLGTVVNAM